MPTRSLVRHAFALAALACLSATHVHAQDMYYPNDATINYAVNGSAVVGYANSNNFNNMTNGTSPIVNFVSGGNIGAALYAFNSSTINVSGGNVGSNLNAQNSSTVNVSGGTFGHGLAAYANSNATISGGTFVQDGGVNLVDQTAGIFTLVGSNLMATNARRDNRYGGTDYDLSGTLQDGTNLNGYVLNVKDSSTFTLRAAAVPETSTLVALPVLLVMLGAGLVRKRRGGS